MAFGDYLTDVASSTGASSDDEAAGQNAQHIAKDALGSSESTVDMHTLAE